MCVQPLVCFIMVAICMYRIELCVTVCQLDILQVFIVFLPIFAFNSAHFSSFVCAFLADGTVCTRVIIVVQILLGGGLHRMLKGAYNSGRCWNALLVYIYVCSCYLCKRRCPPLSQACWSLDCVPAFNTFQSSLRSLLKWLDFESVNTVFLLVCTFIVPKRVHRSFNA